MCLTVWLSASAYDFEVDGIYYNIIGTGQVEVTYENYSHYSGSVVIPSSVTYTDYDGNIHTYSVTYIGSNAFSDCSGLTSVTIPNSVTSIGGSAFYGCKGLTSVTIPNSVTSIGWGFYEYYYDTFDSCTNLTSVTIPKVAMPMDNNFKGCPIANVTIADGVDIICDNAFRGWSTINTVTIPQSVSSVGERIFEGCTGLTTITVDGNNAYLDSRDSCNAIIKTATNQLIAGCVTTVIPRSVKSIRDYAFYDCTGLTSVNIPDSVTSIGDYAFANCSNITDIACYAVTPPTIKSNTFTDYNPTLYVPLGSVSLYSAKAYWKNFFIQPIPGVSHTITVTSNDSLMRTTLGSGTYEENTNAQLVAVTLAGYSFQQ